MQLIAAAMMTAVSTPSSFLEGGSISARNIPPTYANGRADPYLNFKVGQKEQRTKIIEGSLNPVWNEGDYFHLL